LLGDQVEDQVTPRQRTVRVTPRVVIRRPLDHANQQGDLVQFQLRQRLAEEELAGQAEAMHGALAILADEYFVEVGLEDLALVVMHFQQHGHHRFSQLTGEATLAGQVEVFHQLLGQGTAALAHRTGRSVDPHGPGDGLGRHAEVAVEVPVLGGYQGFEQVWRHLVDLDQDAIFEVLRVDAADHQRLKAYHVEFLAVGTGEVCHIVAGEAHTHELRRLHTLVELEATCIEVDGIAVDRRRARAVGRAFTPVTEGVEFGEEVVLAQFLAAEQLQRPGIHLGRDGPALAGELLLNDGIKVNREAGDDHQADQAELQGPAQPGARAAGRAFLRGTGISGSSHGGGLYALYEG